MVESLLKENTQNIVISQEKHLDSEPSYKSKPRALIFKADEKDLDKIKKLIETQFPKVEIIYVTSGPTASILRVTKSVSFKTQDSSIQPLSTVE
jgi:hypothetical protein